MACAYVLAAPTMDIRGLPYAIVHSAYVYSLRDPTPQLGQNVAVGVLPEQHPYVVLGYDVIEGFPCPNVSGYRLNNLGCAWDAKGLGVFGRRGVNG